MKQIVIPRHGKPEVMKIEEKPDPKPGRGDFLIRVHASGINFADVMARIGLYPDAPKLPSVVGYEVAGIVEDAGPEADSSWKGSRVFALTRFGGYCDLISVPSSQVFKIPEGLSFEQAAGIPVTYLTAYQLLVVMGALKKSESILIHNAGGGVGLVIDPLGGKHWSKSYAALRSTGRLGMFGISTAKESALLGVLKLVATAVRMPSFGPISLMSKNRAVFGVNMGRMWGEQEKIREWMGVILGGIAEGWIKPHVDKVFPYQDAAQAHRYIEERRNMGKVILKF